MDIVLCSDESPDQVSYSVWEILMAFEIWSSDKLKLQWKNDDSVKEGNTVEAMLIFCVVFIFEFVLKGHLHFFGCLNFEVVFIFEAVLIF